MCRFLRAVERAAVRRAESTVVRTERARRILLERAGPNLDQRRFYVIPNGKDADQFTPADPDTRSRVRRGLGVTGDAPLLVYVGSLGPQYYPAEMLQLFRSVLDRSPAARLLVLTGHAEALAGLAAEVGVPEAAFIVRRVHPSEVSAHLAAADVGLALRRPSFSQQGVSPIKLAEYLLCGLPVVTNRGIGDQDDQLDESVGIILPELSPPFFKGAAAHVLSEFIPRRAAYRAACRQRGLELFDLDRCAARLSAAITTAAAARAASGAARAEPAFR